MSTVDGFPSPAELGAPPRFTAWRDQQLDAWLSIRSSTARFRIANLPTGSGKQLLAYMLAIAAADEGQRVLLLTESRGLESQYEKEFADARIPLVDIRGAENYRCPALEPGGRYAHLRRGLAEPNASQGPCNSGLPCKLRDDGCPRFDALRAAQSSPIVVSNYAYWMASGATASQQDGDEPLGTFDWLIIDEFHAARSAVSRALAVDLSLRSLAVDIGTGGLRAPERSDDIRDWSVWARSLAARGEERQRLIRESIRAEREVGGNTITLRTLLEQARYLRRHLRALDRVASARGEWVVEVWKNAAGTVKFSPVWPAPYCEEVLYRGVPNVIGMSATISRDSLKYVGIDPQQADYFEYESTFPIANRPVYILPVAKVQWNMSVADEQRWLNCIDAILTSRADRKALVHPVSYDRTQKILTRSRNRHRMVTSTGGKETAQAVERFKDSPQQDQVFVHPGISTGYDFPDAAAEVQIIGKIPFADSRNKLVKAWKKADPEFIYVMAMEYISQTVGRPVRSETDRAETFIVDAHALWFLDRASKYARYAPKHFWESVKVIRGGMLPSAPRRMGSSSTERVGGDANRRVRTVTSKSK